MTFRTVPIFILEIVVALDRASLRTGTENDVTMICGASIAGLTGVSFLTVVDGFFTVVLATVFGTVLAGVFTGVFDDFEFVFEVFLSFFAVLEAVLEFLFLSVLEVAVFAGVLPVLVFGVGLAVVFAVFGWFLFGVGVAFARFGVGVAFFFGVGAGFVLLRDWALPTVEVMNAGRTSIRTAKTSPMLRREIDLGNIYLSGKTAGQSAGSTFGFGVRFSVPARFVAVLKASSF